MIARIVAAHEGNQMIRCMMICSAIVAISACATDQRKDVAFAILFDSQGNPDAQVFTTALTARFPSGSSLSALESFVTISGGACHPKDSGRVWCEVPLREKFCAASMLGIDVSLSADLIDSLKAIPGGVSC